MPSWRRRLRAWASLVILPNRVSLPLSLQFTEDFVRKLLPEQASCCVQCATTRPGPL